MASDVSLVYGVDIATSQAELEKALNIIIKNAKQPQIKLEFTVTVSKLNEAIKAAIGKKTFTGLKLTPTIEKFNASSAIKKLKADVDAVLKGSGVSVKTATTTTTNTIKTNTAAQTKEYTDQDKAVSKLTGSLKRLNEVAGQAKKASGTSEKNLTQQTEQSAKSVERLNQLYLELSQHQQTAQDALKKKDTGTAEKEIQDMESLISEINKYNQALAQEAAAQQKSSKESNKKSISVEDLNKKYSTLNAQIQGGLRNTTAQFGNSSGDYANLQKYAETLNKLQVLFSSGKIRPDQYATAMSNLSKQVSTANNNIKAAGENTKTFGDRVNNLTQKFAMWFGVSQVIMLIVRALREMVQTAIELDSAMNQLEIVTQRTDATYKKFYSTINKSAQEIGASTTDLIDSATVYARLGYTLEESETLSKYTAMLQNVGDIDVSEAQSAITAIIKAFDVDANDIESVMDKLVVVGKNYCPAA